MPIDPAATSAAHANDSEAFAAGRISVVHLIVIRLDTLSGLLVVFTIVMLLASHQGPNSAYDFMALWAHVDQAIGI